jgi:hypothetical protein
MKINDPLEICINALETGEEKHQAYINAKIAHEQWLVVDMSEQEPSIDEAMEMLRIRSAVFAVIGSVYLWNDDFDAAESIEGEFIYSALKWKDDDHQSTEIYLTLLAIKHRVKTMESIFENVEFKELFLPYFDLCQSIRNPNYHFESSSTDFTNTLNNINLYSILLTGEKFRL